MLTHTKVLVTGTISTQTFSSKSNEIRLVLVTQMLANNL